MDRRSFLQAAAIGAAAAGISGNSFAAEKYFPGKADQSLFENINRAKDPANKTPLEKSHAPVITAPDKVKAGEPFTVQISVGENMHSMGTAHWIEYVELNIGNEPVAKADFQSNGFSKPKVSFTVAVSKEAAPSGRITLLARQRCNLHGLWEGAFDIAVE